MRDVSRSRGNCRTGVKHSNLEHPRGQNPCRTVSTNRLGNSLLSLGRAACASDYPTTHLIPRTGTDGMAIGTIRCIPGNNPSHLQKTLRTQGLLDPLVVVPQQLYTALCDRVEVYLESYLRSRGNKC